MQRTTRIELEKESGPGRVAIFFHDLGIGGAERVMLQLAQAFIEAGHPVDLVLARAEGPLLSEVPLQASVIDFDTTSPLVMFIKLIHYLRSERPKALLSPFEVTSVIAIVAKKITGVSTRVVIRISTHISENKRVRWKKIVERLVVSMLYTFADGIVAVSRGVAEDLVSYARISLRRIRIIYNPVITDQILQASKQPVNHPFFDDGRCPVVLGVGRFSEEKDFPTLIQAFDILRRKTPLRMIILGDGEQRSLLENMICRRGLQELVDLPGFKMNPFAYMKRASVFVLSSKWEGLPGALIQALACNCPVVSTDCLSGPSEILKRGEYGHLVPVEDAEALANGIEAVLQGNIRKPPKDWLDQFTIGMVLPQYKAVLGIEV
jgi:glycosyltransferase involved in cell wall biosynthesis